MKFVFNESLLEKNLKDVYELINIPISVFDSNFEFKASYPPTGYLTKYCELIRSSTLRKNRCLECDKQACLICQQTKAPYTYYCHAHVCETISPIYYDNVIAGFLIWSIHNEKKFWRNQKLCKRAKYWWKWTFKRLQLFNHINAYASRGSL